MATPAFDPKGKVPPASLSIVVCLSIIAISFMTMVKPVQASDTPQPSTKWCILPFQNQFPICGYATPAIACDAYTGSVSTQIPVSGYPVGTRYHCIASSGFSPGDTFIKYSCPANSTGSGGTCTCTDPYVPDSAGTSCVLASSCPANMSGSPCVCNSGYVPDPNEAGCVEEQYILSVLQDSLSEVEPGSSRDVIVRVTSALTGNPKNGAQVSLKAAVDDTSGGHAHGGADRDKGTLSGDGACDPPEKYCATATTDTNGYASFTFKAPAVSGEHTVTAACVSHVCTKKDTGMIYVKMPGLHKIPDDPTLYALIGGEADKKHHDNHYLTDNAFSQLVALAINYHFLYPNEPVLHLNDASLVWGGLFDKDGDWDTPHAGHRKGTVIDIRANTALGNIPESLFTDFKDLAAKTKIKLAGRVISAQAKLHCSDGFDPATNCIGDDNRHFHVILLGVDQ